MGSLYNFSFFEFFRHFGYLPITERFYFRLHIFDHFDAKRQISYNSGKNQKFQRTYTEC